MPTSEYINGNNFSMDFLCLKTLSKHVWDVHIFCLMLQCNAPNKHIKI